MSEDLFMLCNAFRGNIEDLNDKWKASLKYDGERIMAKKEGDKVFLFNRRGYDKRRTYPEIAKSLKKIDFDFIIDGEVIAESGKFNDLQKRSNLRDKEKVEERKKEIKVKFMVFDIIEYDKERLENKSLREREEYLKKINFKDNVEIVENKNVEEMWKKAEKQEEEGIIIKDMDSRYKFKRSDKWLKKKLWREEVFEFDRYELNNSGVKLINEKEIEVQVQRNSSGRVENIKERIDRGEKVKANVQYLKKTKNGKLRFPSFKELSLS